MKGFINRVRMEKLRRNSPPCLNALRLVVGRNYVKQFVFYMVCEGIIIIQPRGENMLSVSGVQNLGKVFFFWLALKLLVI